MISTTTPQPLSRPRAVTPSAPATGPAEAIRICAEYLALGIIRRRGLGVEHADYLAHLTGLDPAACARLTRLRDVAEFTTRRQYLFRAVGA